MTIDIADNGTGMPAGPRAVLSRRPGRTGHGLGLAIVDSYVRAMGGSVRLSSELEVGTRVSIRLLRSVAGPEPELDGAPGRSSVERRAGSPRRRRRRAPLPGSLLGRGAGRGPGVADHQEIARPLERLALLEHDAPQPAHEFQTLRRGGSVRRTGSVRTDLTPGLESRPIRLSRVAGRAYSPRSAQLGRGALSRSGVCASCWSLAGLLLVGCFDLAVPSLPADGGVGPDLNVLRPRAGDTISLASAVEVQAASVNGVQSVTVTCGGAPSTGVFTWQVEPYTGLVDFTRCTLVSVLADAGSGFGSLELTFIAVDRLGNQTRKTFTVVLDTTSAALEATLPERVVPRSPLQLTIGSDRPLLLPPTVRLAGTQADGVVQEPNPDGGAPLYRVKFLETPGIGIDTFAGDPQSPPIEVLLETERRVSLTVDARALNQNPSHLEQGVLLSRVVWDRQVPGRVANAATFPVAAPEGLELALAMVDTSPTASSAWLPGLFRAEDGTYAPFDPAIVQGPRIPAGSFGLDAGWAATGFDARGRTVFARPAGNGSEVLFLDPPSGGTIRAAGQTVPFPVLRPLTRMDDLVCSPDVLTGPAAGACVSPATQTVSCASAAGASVVASVSGAVLGAPTPGTVAGSPGSQRTYVAPNDQSGCGQAWTGGTLGSGVLLIQPRIDLNGCAIQSVDRLLAVVDGSFVVALTSSCGGTPDYPVLAVGPTGAITGNYLVTAGEPTAVKPAVLAVLGDGSIVTLRNDPPFTTFERWPPGATAPSATARVPGLYLYQATPARLGAGVSVGGDGSLGVLLNSAALGDMVLSFGPGLQPQWLYRYPRIAAGSVLLGDDLRGLVYYVDPLNNEAVALKRSGGVSPATISGTITSSQGGPLAGVAVVVTPSGGSALPSATTGSAGGYAVTGVPPGAGAVTLLGLPGKCSAPSPAAYTLAAGGSVTVNVTVRCSTGAATGIYVANASAGSVTVFALDAVGNTPPLRTIAGSNTGLSTPIGMAFDSAGNLYVANRGSGTVSVFAPGASGDSTPIRVLRASGMNAPESVAIPPTDEVWVGTCPGCGGTSGGTTGLFHFPPGSTQSDGLISGSSTGLSDPGVLVDERGNLIVTNAFGGPLEFFPSTARGDVAPTRSFHSVATNAQGVSYGPGLNTLAIADPQRILFYPADTPSSATPVQPSAVLSSFPGVSVTFFGGLYLDGNANPPLLYATDQLGAGRIYVMALSGTAPAYGLVSVREISGPATGLSQVVGVTVVH